MTWKNVALKEFNIEIKCGFKRCEQWRRLALQDLGVKIWVSTWFERKNGSVRFKSQRILALKDLSVKNQNGFTRRSVPKNCSNKIWTSKKAGSTRFEAQRKMALQDLNIEEI